MPGIPSSVSPSQSLSMVSQISCSGTTSPWQLPQPPAAHSRTPTAQIPWQTQVPSPWSRQPLPGPEPGG